ncbi:TIR domain-containing protein [Mucilaginibacter sp. X5P1]|uniref:TIR domain-containing protein n=1 Tax=Mucilaginibacter sp. X5P1 TaxID=2723088 RepID=UPI00160C6D32|nr:TIR domain-containing protein [Mucilaginibacter sp. X5P1]MBB6137626.1 hypothetical protein [Mucilaginibacter sp. X5P1]
MAKKLIFYSFHFDNDVMRVQQIRNIGVIEGNEPVKPNEWETLQRSGDAAIEKWIRDNIKNKDCVIVLVGADTASRKFVKYEIKQAWEQGKGLLGIYIHNINCPRNGKCSKGKNPFEQFTVGTKKLSEIVKCYDPGPDAYNNISENIADLIDDAIKIRKNY